MPRPRRPPNTARSSTGTRSHARLVERSLRQGARALYLDAGLFDQLYRRRSQDVRFYVDTARRFGGPVLELGVGSGRVASALARAGLDVVGVDLIASKF